MRKTGAVVPAMEHSTTLATTVSGGVRQRAVQASPGTATCSTTRAMFTGTTMVSRMGCQFVAFGIDYFSIDRTVFNSPPFFKEGQGWLLFFSKMILIFF